MRAPGRSALRCGAALALALSAACATPKPDILAQTERPEVLRDRRFFYVERHAGDARNYADLIRQEIEALGMRAGSGAPADRPADADVRVRYFDRFAWNWGTYMVAITLLLYDAESGDLLAASRAYSVDKIEPDVMIREALAGILAEAPAAGG